MKKFDGVLLATDFDGTLNNDKGITTSDVIEAVEYFKANGGLFAVSTGRTYQGLSLYDNKKLFNAPALFANGAVAYDLNSEKNIFFDGIGDEGLEVARAINQEFPEVSIEMYPFDSTYAINLTEMTERHFTNQGIPFKVISDPADAPRPWAKVMLGCTEESSPVVQKFISDNFTKTSYLPTTGSFIEVMKSNINKGTGLLKLADHLGVSNENAYAAGDGYNDVDMLKVAAGAFVPCNGSDEALAVATHVVRSNNDGTIAHAIEILDKIY